MSPPVDPAEVRVLCSTCCQPLPVTGKRYCPECARYWGRPFEQVARVADYVAAMAMLLVSVVVCVPTTSILLDAIRSRWFNTFALVAVVWHSWIWGPSIVAVAFAWRHNVLHNRPSAEGLLKVYQRVQLFTLLMPFVTAMLIVLADLLVRATLPN